MKRLLSILVLTGLLLILCACADSPLHEQANGFWEDDYYFYLQLEDGHLTLRDYSKAVVLDTAYTLTQQEGRILLTPEDSILAYDDGTAYGSVKDLYLEGGRLHLTEVFTFNGQENEYFTYNGQENEYWLSHVDHGPFDDILILDEEILPRLAGEWVEEDGGEYAYGLNFEGNALTMTIAGVQLWSDRIHAIRYVEDNRILVVSKELGGYHPLYCFEELEYDGESLSGFMMVYDGDGDYHYRFVRP